MGKTIRGFNGQPSEPDYPLPADLPFSVALTQDNGARAAERLELAGRLHGQWDGDCYDRHEWQDCRSRTWWEGKAAAILANGAVFVPDAAELDRLRRIEAAARDLTEKEPRGTLNRYRWNALLAALQPEGSAGTHGSGPPAKGPYDPDRIRERVARAAEGSARDGG